ncbi:hypothetical protein ACO1O0_003088 [Amphichorda felina]
MLLPDLPDELLEPIILELTSPSDISALTRTCWRLFHFGVPWLYRCGSNRELLDSLFAGGEFPEEDSSDTDDDEENEEEEGDWEAKVHGPPIPDALWRAIERGNLDTVRRGIEVAPEILSLGHIQCAITHFDRAILALVLGKESMREQLRSSVYPWIRAIKCENSEALEMMLGLEPIDVNRLVHWDTTALHMSASRGDVRSVKLLLDHGADMESRNGMGMSGTPLYYALTKSHWEVFLLLAERGADVEKAHGPMDCLRVEFCPKLLFQAARLSSAVTFRDLFEYGAARQIESIVGHSLDPVLVGAAARDDGDAVEIVRFLLQKGADANAQLSDGYGGRKTALYEAAGHGTAETVEELLTWGADVQVVGAEGDGVLNPACAMNSAGVVRILIEHGAPVNRSSDQRSAPLHQSMRRWGGPGIEITRLLLDHGAEVDARAEQGRTPLILAARADSNDPSQDNRYELVRMLLEHGADANTVDDLGTTALVTAAAAQPGPGVESDKRTELVRVLLKHGADPNKGIKHERTALEWAMHLQREIYPGRKEIIKLLLEHGAVKGREEAEKLLSE